MMKKKLLKVFSFILRQIFVALPGITPFVAKFSKAVFSPFLNENITLLSGLGLQSLQSKPVKTQAMQLTIVLPIRSKLILSDYTQASSFYSGLPPICATLIEHAEPRSLFFDIGANIGLVSLAVSQVLPASSIHAFEVNPETFSKLISNFNTNCLGAHAHQIGLSNQTGPMRLSMISNDSGSSTLDTSRFQKTKFWHGQKTTPSFIDVKTMTFDSWATGTCAYQIENASHLLFKIDVEGFEKNVLEGMHGFLSTRKKHNFLIIIETENTNREFVHDFFKRLDFVEHKPCWNTKLETFPHHTDLVFKRVANIL
jgi:FkbM family methyltransferase